MKKISKNTVLLGGAVGLGVLCFIGANYYLRSYLSQAESRLQSNYTPRKVIVAAVEVPAGGILTADNLATRSIPERYLASTALGPADLDAVVGQKVMATLKPGDPIDRGALERTDKAALSTVVAIGERAITFPVDEISSISGMLVPGDQIDLLYTGPGTTANSYARSNMDASGGPKELTVVRAIMQGVTVLATGKTTQKRVVKNPGGSEEEVAMDFTTVTLKVTPQQAQKILIGQKLGQLTAVLRNPDDKAQLTKTVLDETVFREAESAPRAGVGNFVEMIIGGTGEIGGTRVKSETGSTLLVGALANAAGGAPGGAAGKAAVNPGDVRSRLGITPPARGASGGGGGKSSLSIKP